MSEYMEKFNVSKLIGAPPGYIGYDEAGQLTERIRRNPYSIILFDEIEKAHHEIFNILLQILDNGFLTDGQGRHVDFRNTTIIMTTNMGTSQMNSLGFMSNDGVISYDKLKQDVQAEIKKNFRVEFLNRLSGIIIFKPLTMTGLEKIFGLLLQNIKNRLSEQKIIIQVSKGVQDFLLQQSDFNQYGARALSRLIEKYIEDFLANELLKRGIEGPARLQLKLDKKKTIQLTVK